MDQVGSGDTRPGLQRIQDTRILVKVKQVFKNVFRRYNRT